MEHLDKPQEAPQAELQYAAQVPLYINRPLYTDADIERAEVQEQAA